MLFYRLFLLFVLLILGGTLSQAKPPKPINLVTGEWEPFTGKQLENYGIITEIVTAVFNEMGYKPNFFFYSWTVAPSRMLEGDFLATFPFIKSPAREEKFLFSDPLLSVEIVLFYKETSLKAKEEIKRVEDLSRFRIGRVDGYEFWEALAKQAQNTIVFDDVYAAFEALHEGKVDFVPESKIVGQQILRGATFTHDASNFTFLPFTHTPGIASREGLHLMMTRNSRNRNFLKRFNSALAKIKETAFYERRRIHAAELEQNPSIKTRVKLKPTLSFPLPFGRRTPESEMVVHLPPNCRGIVLDWEPSFLGPMEPISVLDRAGSSKIKILDGPLAGKILYINNAFIHLD